MWVAFTFLKVSSFINWRWFSIICHGQKHGWTVILVFLETAVLFWNVLCSWCYMKHTIAQLTREFGWNHSICISHLSNVPKLFVLMYAQEYCNIFIWNVNIHNCTLRHVIVFFCVYVCVDILLHAPKSFQPICYIRTVLKSRMLEALLCLRHQRWWLMNTEQVSESFSVLNRSGDDVKHWALLNFWILSIVQHSKENSISETGSSIRRWKGGRHSRMERYPVSKTLCTLPYWMISSNSLILSCWFLIQLWCICSLKKILVHLFIVEVSNPTWYTLSFLV